MIRCYDEFLASPPRCPARLKPSGIDSSPGLVAFGSQNTLSPPSKPLHGQITEAVPIVTYAPDPGFTGEDQFTFSASDGMMASVPGIISIHLVSSGDMDGSGRVDGFDLGNLGLVFGSRASDADWNPMVDLDGDGIVDGSDLTILGAHFGNGIVKN